MKKIKVKKLFNGCISLRDYVVENNPDGILVEFNGKSMFLTLEDLKNGKPSGVFIQSKWGNRKYELIDFQWKPEQTQEKLF